MRGKLGLPLPRVKSLPFGKFRRILKSLGMKRYCDHLCDKFQLAMAILAKPWNGLIIASLENGPARFSELQERMDSIGDRMLSERLKELVASGLVARHVHEGPPIRVEYELTEAGRGFRPVADAITRWGEMLEEAQGRGPPKKPARPRR